MRFIYLGEDCSSLLCVVRPIRCFGGCNRAFCSPEAVAFPQSLTEATKHPPLIREHDGVAAHYRREIGRPVQPREVKADEPTGAVASVTEQLYLAVVKIQVRGSRRVDWTRVRSGSGVRPMRGTHGKRVDNPFLLSFRVPDPGRGLSKLFPRFPCGTGPRPLFPHRSESRIEQAKSPRQSKIC